MNRRHLAYLLLLGAGVLVALSVRGPASLVHVGGTLYPAPGAAPIRDAILVVEGERIVAVGPRGEVEVPRGAEVVDVGGRLLFGTDVGYLPHYDPTREYELLRRSELAFPAVLASLTTAPAAEFGLGDRTGRLKAGFDADVVVVDGDPARDLPTLARAWLVLKRGRVLFRADGPRTAE